MPVLDNAFQRVRRSAFAHGADAMSDGALLELFVARQDEAAFEALVRRHGHLVLGVCRRILGNIHDADDAFQATFLVLVRKAASLRRPTLGNWLCGVAYNTALRARAQALRRRQETDVSRMRRHDETDDAGPDWQPVLDEELSRLAEKAREAIVLCDLEDKTRKEAATRLGIPEGTLSGRLMTARRLLANRLARRGVMLSGACAAFLSRDAATAAPSAPLILSTVNAATQFALDNAAALSASVAALAEGVLKAMLISKLKLTAALTLALALLLGLGAALHSALAAPASDLQATAQPAPLSKIEPEEPVAFVPAPKLKGGVAPVAAEIGREVFALTGHALCVSCVAFSPDGKRLATASSDGTVKVWDMDNGREMLTLKGHRDHVWRVAFSPVDNRLASGGADGTVRVWDLDGGRELLAVNHRAGSSVHALAFSPDGKRLASGNGAASGALTVKIWDSTSGAALHNLLGYGGMINSLAFSPDGRRLASASGDRKLKIWDAHLGRELASVTRKDNFFASVAFSHNGDRLVTGNDDRTVAIWDAATLKEVLVLKGHKREVTSAAFSHDNRLIASSGFDATIKLWDAATGKLLASHGGHVREIHSVAFNRLGTRLASGSADGVVKVWEIRSSVQQR